MSTIHIIYDDSAAKAEIGYDPPIQTLEGLCLQMIEWNEKVERGIIEKGGLAPQSNGATVPVPVPFEASRKA